MMKWGYANMNEWLITEFLKQNEKVNSGRHVLEQMKRYETVLKKGIGTWEEEEFYGFFFDYLKIPSYTSLAS